METEELFIVNRGSDSFEWESLFFVFILVPVN